VVVFHALLPFILKTGGNHGKDISILAKTRLDLLAIYWVGVYLFDAAAMSDISFKYPDAAEYVLKDVSFKAKKGETVAFIGSTGSGKR